MALIPRVMFGEVMHKRLSPQENAFRYNIYYLGLPLSQLNKLALPVNRFGLLSFHNRDHAARDGGDLESWARQILRQHRLGAADGDIVMLTLPRVLGYVFNPVSFWFCLDKREAIRAVICEVNNTFGETHTYLAAHPDGRVIEQQDVLRGEKVFHVSPFMPREGFYSFRFAYGQDRCAVGINYHDVKGEKQLVTALSGALEPMTSATLRKAFWAYPLITLRAILLIHWQAVKLVFKGCRYFAKPMQKKNRVSATEHIT